MGWGVERLRCVVRIGLRLRYYPLHMVTEMFHEYTSWGEKELRV